MANWRIFAAATGSALAMATNASAGVIYFDQAVTVGPIGNVAMSNTERQSQNIVLTSANGENIGFSFKVGIFQNFSSNGFNSGGAFLASPKIALLDGNTNGELKKLAFGVHISTVHGVEWGQGGVDLASQSTSANVRNVRGWAANATGLAGFRFTTANHEVDYGWVRLSYTLGTNGLPTASRPRIGLTIRRAPPSRREKPVRPHPNPRLRLLQFWLPEPPESPRFDADGTS